MENSKSTQTQTGGVAINDFPILEVRPQKAVVIKIAGAFQIVATVEHIIEAELPKDKIGLNLVVPFFSQRDSWSGPMPRAPMRTTATSSNYPVKPVVGFIVGNFDGVGVAVTEDQQLFFAGLRVVKKAETIFIRRKMDLT
ncbi:MAG: hypothetical protein R2825_12980 [Saprospiraceae bacterium]